MFIYLISGLIFVVIYHYFALIKRKYNKPKHLSHLKDVPLVSGELPLVGHSLKFDPTNVNFLNECQQKYGKIFRIKMFITDVIVITDRSLLEEYYKTEETKLSFITVLIKSFLGAGISQKDEFINTALSLIKANLKINYDDYIPKIKSECTNMVQFIKNMPKGKSIDVNSFVRKFIISSSTKCFLSIDLDEKSYNMILNYVDLLGKIFISSAIIPRIILEITAKPILRYYRKYIVDFFKPTIDKYRNDPEFNDSIILRKSIDFIDSKTNTKLTDDQIGGIMISAIFASYGSTSLGLSAMISDLISNPEYWYRIRNETGSLDNDMLKSAKLLDASFWETCRTSSSFLTVLRYAVTPNESVGDYYLGQNILIGFCASLLMVDEENTMGIFENSQKYDPERYLAPRNEKISSSSIVTFGGKKHFCPGRNFAKMEILMAIAYLTKYFEPFKIVEISKSGMMTAGGFVERKTFMIVADESNEN